MMKERLTAFMFYQIITANVHITYVCAVNFEELYFTRRTGYRSLHKIMTQQHVSNVFECGLHCMSQGCCTAFNYHDSVQDENPAWNCEILETKSDFDVNLLEKNSEYSFYKIVENKCLNDGECHVNPSSSFGYSCVCPCCFTGRRCDEREVFKSCKELSSCESEDGEYYLQLQFPACNKSVRVFCADMNTSDPKEYITLISENNFSHLDNTMSPQAFNHYGSTTNFSKIRITPELQVITTDHRFAQITWNDTKVIFERYGSAGDCIVRTCTSDKNGKFKMDVEDTGFHFVMPIKWQYHGWPQECSGQQPLNYIVDVQEQVVSGNCGSRCGGCRAQDLYLNITGC